MGSLLGRACGSMKLFLLAYLVGQLLRTTTDFCLLRRIQQWQFGRWYLCPFFLLPNNEWTGVRLSVHLQWSDTQPMHLEWLLNSMVQHPNRWFWKPHKWELWRLCKLLPRGRSPAHKCSYCASRKLQVRESQPGFENCRRGPDRGERVPLAGGPHQQ